MQDNRRTASFAVLFDAGGGVDEGLAVLFDAGGGVEKGLGVLFAAGGWVVAGFAVLFAADGGVDVDSKVEDATVTALKAKK